MGSALRRGRTLNRAAVKVARDWRRQRIETLIGKRDDNTATMKELRELRWKWGVRKAG